MALSKFQPKYCSYFVLSIVRVNIQKLITRSKLMIIYCEWPKLCVAFCWSVECLMQIANPFTVSAKVIWLMTEMPLAVFVVVYTHRLLYCEGQNVPVNTDLISMCGFEPENSLTVCVHRDSSVT